MVLLPILKNVCILADASDVSIHVFSPHNNVDHQVQWQAGVLKQNDLTENLNSLHVSKCLLYLLNSHIYSCISENKRYNHHKFTVKK